MKAVSLIGLMAVIEWTFVPDLNSQSAGKLTRKKQKK